jgi:hypothetical protein
MNRRHFIGALASTAAITTIAQEQANGADTSPAKTAAAATLVRTPLVLMAPRRDGIEAIWGVNQLCKGKLEWEGADGSKGIIHKNNFGFVPQGEDILRVTLNGLKPGLSYKVRSITISAADDKQEISPWKTFKTMDPSGSALKFAVWNDTHIHNDTIQKLHEITPAADFLMWNGDTCNNWTSPELLVPTLLHPGEQDITQGRPLLHTWGNHDVRGPHAYQMPRLTPTISGKPYYSFRSGPVAFICMHTGEDKPDNHPSFGGRVAFEALRKEQAEWLAETIRLPELRDAPYRILFCHIPLRWLQEQEPDYDHGGFDHVSLRSRQAWHQSLVEWKTQLVISGHTHQSALIQATDAFPYHQLVGGGPQLKAATHMLAEATPNEFAIEVKDLQKQTKHALKLKPLV